MENQPKLKNFNLNIILTCQRDKVTARMGLQFRSLTCMVRSIIIYYQLYSNCTEEPCRIISLHVADKSFRIL